MPNTIEQIARAIDAMTCVVPARGTSQHRIGETGLTVHVPNGVIVSPLGVSLS
jgi:hypothetical protein